MKSPTLSTKSRPSRNVAYVRLSDDEFSIIESDAIMTGKSIIDLLKECYFNGKIVEVLMPASESREFLTELNRIGNNLNQIARTLNRGLFAVDPADFKEVRTKLDQILSVMVNRRERKLS